MEQKSKEKNLIGIIGGPNLCVLPGLDIREQLTVETPYGKPSGSIRIGKFNGVEIAFLPRHGDEHSLPPHKIPYMANVVALKSLGVKHIIATCLAGSLRKKIKPGTFVTPDQFINMTWGRDDNFKTGQEVIHLPMAQPFCEHTQKIIAREVKAMSVPCFSKGTAVVIQGPRFATIAESKMYAKLGGDIICMTPYPECYFAQELGLCYGAVATVTDYDVGIPSTISVRQEGMKEVVEIIHSNTEKTVILLEKLVNIAKEISNCNCAEKNLININWTEEIK